ncbi:hypothetical protein FBU59_000029 [Linderina macrospora]|uniref:Uncharacterized protein n=1 Tax=Linderina macrospora TaxID=4868 RepID=A0ACC1JI07_9FUNG|nr:hypothetical protein FBU59_000029 [Linderina macrospora]
MLNTYTGLVAANCFKNASNIYADKSVYDIYIEGGNGTNPYRTAVVDFSFHSSYDPKTLANNVYGIRFNSPTKYNIDNRLGLNLKDYSKFIFSRKIISDVANMKWTSTATAVTNLTAPRDDGTSCTVPYSQVYGVTSNGTTAILQFYRKD